MTSWAVRSRRWQREQASSECTFGRDQWRRIAAILLVGSTFTSTVPAAESGDKLLVVDCLLPARVHQLGTGMTFLAPRQAIKTSANDCELRGGEYVAVDRASGAAALRVWLPQAERGDKIAQTYVGEIFEKGIGTQADYPAAANWYRKAAAQGHPRAMINIGFLYEKGLGVDKDPVAAVNWYRKAAGLDEDIRLDSNAPANREAELQELRNELERVRQQLERSREALKRERGRSNLELEQWRSEQRAASAAGDLAGSRRLESMLLEKENALRRRDNENAELEKVVRRHQDQVAALEGERDKLKQQLDQSERALAAGREELARRQQIAEQAKGELARLQARAQRGAASDSALARVKFMEDELARRELELGEQRAKITRLEQASAQAREQIQQSSGLPSRPDAPVAGPSIQLIDPDLLVTRSPTVVPLRRELKYRDIVGRVVAPAGLLSLTVNDSSLVPDQNGLFKTRVDILQSPTKVYLVAVDRAGSSARMEFLLQPSDGGVANVATKPPAPPAAGFGRYHALVIGNQKYQALPPLSTPEADAKAISELLASRYGFEVKTLLNATRYDILAELNRLRSKLTDQDNLLVYYAGHGEIDRVNQRGYWLPTDAEPNSDANWISSIAITDILNAMAVKQAIVIADSCYSGALTRSSLGRLDSGKSDEARANWLKSMAQSRSRTVLTSGGVKPVLDGGGGTHSVFAGVLIRVLRENTEIIEAQRVYQEISARVLNLAMTSQFDQRPEYAPMRFAGHESGDFIFVPRAR